MLGEMLLDLFLLKGAIGRVAGIVDQDIWRPICSYNCGADLNYIVATSNVTNERSEPLAWAAELGKHPIDASLLVGHHDDPGFVPVKRLRQRQADPRRASCDDYKLVLKCGVTNEWHACACGIYRRPAPGF